MIKGRARVTNPDEAKLELTIEMTVREWRLIRDQMPQSWPSWDFARLIRNALDGSIDHVEQIREVDG